MQNQRYTIEEQDKILRESLAKDKLDNLEIATGSCVTFNLLTGGVGIAFIVIFSAFLALFVYLKWFRGSINFSKLTSKFKRK